VSNDNLAGLRRVTVLVILGLLVFVVGADVLDGVVGANTFQVDVGFYTMIGGVLLGVLAAEAIAAVRK
jgi:hypothetical protein